MPLGWGYQGWRAVVGLAAIVLLAAGLSVGFEGGTAAVSGGGRCPVVDRIGLAIDTAVPPVQTGAGDRRDLATGTGPGRLLAGAGWGVTLLGWGFASLVVAGYSGLVRRT